MLKIILIWSRIYKRISIDNRLINGEHGGGDSDGDCNTKCNGDAMIIIAS